MVSAPELGRLPAAGAARPPPVPRARACRQPAATAVAVGAIVSCTDVCPAPLFRPPPCVFRRALKEEEEPRW